MKEGLRSLVVGEEGISVDVVEIAGAGGGAARGDADHVTGVQAKQVVQPFLHLIAVTVPDGFIQSHLVKDTPWWTERKLLRSENNVKTHKSPYRQREQY